ncbi:hypothetical protein LCGC14_3055110 [marine sediment metagenome]|uniref:Uncharacterized protein n=1 Tax=marine sediment metagenome TaxID=412755 RepID=A0A0F8YTH3_9ZZZZ
MPCCNCTQEAKYIASGRTYCKQHLKVARAFNQNPMEISTGKAINRHVLYHHGLVIHSVE